MAAGGGGEDKTEKKKKGKVGKTPAGEEKKCGGERISYHHHGFDNVQRCPVGSVSVQAWSPGESRAQQRGGEEESKRAARRRARGQEGGEEHVLPFYRGICECAEHFCIRAVPAMRAARLDKSVFARPWATLCASAVLSCRSLWQLPSRGQQEMAIAMSRQNQFVAVFYTESLI